MAGTYTGRSRKSSPHREIAFVPLPNPNPNPSPNPNPNSILTVTQFHDVMNFSGSAVIL